VNSSAGTASTEFGVTATVVNHCMVASRGISFGSYDPTSPSAMTAQGAITARCTKGDSVSVALNQGASPAPGSTAAVPARRMTNGSSYLPYHIYIGAPPNKEEWGAGGAGRSEPPAQVAAAWSTPITFITYASLPAGTNVPAGEYSDVVTATVTF